MRLKVGDWIRSPKGNIGQIRWIEGADCWAKWDHVKCELWFDINDSRYQKLPGYETELAKVLRGEELSTGKYE